MAATVEQDLKWATELIDQRLAQEEAAKQASPGTPEPG